MKTIFAYCPNCKSENISTQNGHKHVCADCKFEYFHNVAAAVMVILQCNNEILFAKRNENPSKGMLDFPGGFMDYNESATETVIREIKEELYFDLAKNEIRFFSSYPNQYLYKNILYHTLDLGFIVTLEKNRISSFNEQEIESIIWIKKNEIAMNEIAFESTKKFISDYLKS